MAHTLPFSPIIVIFLAVPVFAQTLSIPYVEDFESGSGGWTGEGDWELGVPNVAPLDSAHVGAKAWGTKLAGPYSRTREDFLTSPTFDFSSLTIDPIISFGLNYEYESASSRWDGLLMEIRIDGGTWELLGSIGSGTGWYDATIREGFENPRAGYPSWGGLSNGWIVTSHVMTGSAGASAVEVRFVHATDDWSSGDGGVTVDDVRIGGYREPWLLILDSDHEVIAANTSRAVPPASVVATNAYTLHLVNWSEVSGLDVTQLEVVDSSNVGTVTINGNPSPTAGPGGIGALGMAAMSLEFDVHGPGNFWMDVAVSHNGSNGSPYLVTLEGVAGPGIGVRDHNEASIAAGGTFDWSTFHPLDHTAEAHFTVDSIGSEPLEITSIRTANVSNAAIDELYPERFAGHGAIAPGAVGNVTIEFTPIALGLIEFDVLFEHNGSNAPTPFVVRVRAYAGISGSIVVNNDLTAEPDYVDLGALFADLMSFGLGGPTEVVVYQGTGAYVSSSAYRLAKVPGQGPKRPLLIRAADGNRPVIEGNGATFSDGTAAIAFSDVSHLTLRAFESSGSTDLMHVLQWSILGRAMEPSL